MREVKKEESGKEKLSWKAIAAIVWLLFSLALAGWWLIFALGQADRIAALAGQSHSEMAQEVARRHRMLLSEGATLILLLFGGGGALLYHIRQESLRARRLREFFAAFTHDLKTSLASLRLQAESLEEDLKSTANEKIMRRLVKDTVRLELQLENSLLLASPDDSSRFFIEPIRLAEVLEPLPYNWPDLKITTSGDAFVECDQRALEGILKNLIQNASVHGRATEVQIQAQSSGEKAVIRVLDNGRGFKGDHSQLGAMFGRQSTTSGSGLGLYLARRLARQMKGDLRLPTSAQGFVVEIVLPLAREVAK